MRLTVLGASAVRPNPAGACAGYLVEHEGRTLLVDCGSGALANLLRVADPCDLEAVVISHAHPDHILDLVGLRYGYLYAPSRRPAAPMPVYATAASLAVLRAVGHAFEPEGDFWSPFDLRAISDRSEISLAGLSVTFAPTVHYMECLAARFAAPGAVLVYTADTGPTAELTEFARDADLLISECTLPRRAGYEEEWGHLAPDEAAALAVACGARSLLLTHYFAECEPERLKLEAATLYSGPIAVAKEMETHVIA